MAYAQTDQNARRMVTIGAVAAIHAVAIYAIVTGLTVAFTPFLDPPFMPTHNDPLPKVIPTPVHLKAHREEQREHG